MSLQTAIEKITGWVKTYSRINWESKTGLSAANLNKMDMALDEIDNRVVILGQQKLDKDTANGLVRDWSLDEDTGVITVTFLDGTKANYTLNVPDRGAGKSIEIATERIVGVVKAGPDIRVAKDGTMELSGELKVAIESIGAALLAHTGDRENPHDMTARQIGAVAPKELAEYLPLAGGELTGQLYFVDEKHERKGAILQKLGAMHISSSLREDCADIVVDVQEQLADALLLAYLKDGCLSSYRIFGEHYLCPDGAGAHNNTYRGKALGPAVTQEQWEAIANGTFSGLYIGDYWIIGGINYRIAAFDYYLCSGDTPGQGPHHVTLVPDNNMYDAAMNDIDTTVGAYVGSKMYQEGLTQAKETIKDAFGADHILTHRQYLQSAVTDGYSVGGAWHNSAVALMTEQNVYGGRIFGNCQSSAGWPNLYTIDKSQYPLFTMRPDLISNRQTYWLRDVASASAFCHVNHGGSAAAYGASGVFGVRPAFSIKEGV